MAKLLWASPLSRSPKIKEHLFLACIAISQREQRALGIFKKISGDNLLLKGKQDDIRININQAWERQYWSKKFGITQKKLREVVKRVGCLVRDVKRECNS